MRPTRFIFQLSLTCVLYLAAAVASGQDYPVKPIRVVTASAGGGSDFVARQVAQGISGPLGQPVIVDNRGSGVLPGEFAAKAPPDGYTLLINGGSTWLLPLLQSSPYDGVRDFSPISIISRNVNVFVVHPSVPAHSIKELIALAKAKPGQLNYSLSSIGGGGHLAAELFKAMAGVNIVSVGYKGASPAVTGVIVGEVQLTVADAGLVKPHTKSGKLRALAVTSAEPTALAPELPTMAASGLPGYDAIGVTGVLAPSKTSPLIINRLNQEVVRFLKSPDIKERFLNAGEELVGSSTEQFAAKIASDMTKTSKLIKDLGIKVN